MKDLLHFSVRCRVHGVCVCDDAAYFLGHIDEHLKDLGLEGVKASDITSVIEGYKGRGYGLSTDSELGKEFGHTHRQQAR